MANVQLANSFFIDTQYAVSTDELAIKNVKVLYVIVSATGANARLLLGDQGQNKLDLRVATSGASQEFDFSRNPIIFSQSIRPITLTNATATVVYALTGT